MNPEPRPGAQIFLPVWERRRRMTGWVLGPLTFLGLWWWPFRELTPEAHRLLAIWGLVVVLWVTEALPLGATACLGASLCVILGVGEAREIFRSFGHPILFLFVGSFLLAAGLERQGLSRRLAVAMLSMRSMTCRPPRILAGLALGCMGLSMWISNSSAAAIFFPMGMAVLSEMARQCSGASGRAVRPEELPQSRVLLLAIAFGASIGGMATPVGSPPNLIALAFLRQQTELTLGFFQWLALALPVTVILGGFMIVYFTRVARPWPRELAWQPRGSGAETRAAGGRWTRGEVQVLVAFSLTVTLWILPGLVALVAGVDSPFYQWLRTHLPEEICALLGALLLLALPVDLRRGEFTLGWEEIRRLDWGTILLFGGGLALGDAAVNTGLARWIGDGLVHWLPEVNTFTLTLLFTGVAVLLTEITSNTATANLVVPMALAAARSAEVEPAAPALGACLGASLAFMLPVSTPPNALVYGSGWVPLRTMLRHGLVLDLVGIGVVVAVMSWWLPCVLRWTG